jgi:hypothetical protein
MEIGVIIRDKKGEVLATLIELQNNIIAPDVAKSMTALRAINFSCALRFFRIILKGDAFQIVLRKGESSKSVYGHLIEETRGF